MRILLAWPNKDQFGFKPIGISLLSALLKENGHHVGLFDTSYIDMGFSDNTGFGVKIKMFKEVDYSGYDLSKSRIDLEQEARRVFDNFKPDIVAISALLDEVEIGFRIAAGAKRWDKNTVVVWGNKSATMEPERIMANSNVDYLCVGEGIQFMPELAHRLEQGQDIANLPNLVWRNSLGQVQRNSLAPYFQDLDGLPYLDWSIFSERQFLKPYDGHVYRGGDHMIYWGCPNQCTYCINGSYRKLYGKKAGKFIRRYSIERIIEELKDLTSTYDIQFYKFHDEDFAIKPIEYFRELAEAYSSDVGVPFTCMVNAANVTPEKVALMNKMNCVSVTVGIETGNERIRHDILRRRESKQDIINAVHLFNNANIRTSSFNMLGLPFETRETLIETVEINRLAHVRYPNVGFFFPLPGTPLRDIAIQEGFLDKDFDEIYQDGVPSLKLPNLGKDQLVQFIERFLFFIKLPHVMRPFIERSEISDDVGHKLTWELKRIYEESVFANEGFYDDCGQEKLYMDRLCSIWEPTLT